MRDFAINDFNQFEDLCLFLLDNCVLLPIECAGSDNALTIFDTLNDRGLPLTEVDIFKAKLYQHCKKENREIFIEGWSNLADGAGYCLGSIEVLFRLYMHILRAKEGTTKSEIALKTFFTQDKCKRLFAPQFTTRFKKDSRLLVLFCRYVE